MECKVIKGLWGGAALLIALAAYILSINNAYAIEPYSKATYNISTEVYSLGNYTLRVTSSELPSKKLLPLTVVYKDYFNKSIKDIDFEVDNLPPSAMYSSRNIVKVDVIFASGTLANVKDYTDYLKTVETTLGSSSNNFDVMVKQVETTTLDLNSLTPEEILNTWYNYPGLGGHYAAGWYADGGVLSTTENVNWTGFLNWTDEAKQTIDGTYEFSLTFSGGHQDPQGWTFRTVKNDDGSYSFYGVEVNQNYGNINLYCITKWVPSLGYDTHGGPYYHGCISGCDGTYDGSQKTAHREGATGYHLGRASVGRLSRYNIKIENEGSSIKVYSDGQLVISATDNSLKQGTYGPYTVSQWEANFSGIKVTTGGTKTLGEAISDVEWRDGSVRFVIHASDDIIREYDPENDNREADKIYTVTKLLNSNAYLINLGTYKNSSIMQDLIKCIQQADGTAKGKYYSNSPVYSAMDNACDYITETARKYSVSEDWILVNTEVIWDTTYIDKEHDLPLNFGEHDGNSKYNGNEHSQPQDNSDYKNLVLGQWNGSTTEHNGTIYTDSLTHIYEDTYDSNGIKQAKLLAEKWKYRHFNYFFDNSDVQESYHNVWIEDPIELFQYPGKYRINYKRKDNPFYENAAISYAFDNYRYWSTDYDYRVTQST